MGYRVFAQRTESVVNVEGIARSAEKWFSRRVEVVEGADPASVVLKLGAAEFRIHARPATEEDRAQARIAEARGKAAGMAALAARCPCLWEVSPSEDTNEIETLRLCAVLASTGLGPVLPPDESTLFGVRGAMERVIALESNLR